RAFDQELRQRAQRAVLKRDDPDLLLCWGELDWQQPYRGVSSWKFQDVARDDSEEASPRRQLDAHTRRIGINHRAWRFEPAGTERCSDERIVIGSGRRPSPRLGKQFGKVDLTAASPGILHARNDQHWRLK